VVGNVGDGDTIRIAGVGGDEIEAEFFVLTDTPSSSGSGGVTEVVMLPLA
jgi:hypothetical protein